MNKIKRFNLSIIALVITTLMFLTSCLSAQQRQGQGPPTIPNETQINKMVEDLSAELSLSKKQETKILEIFTFHFTELKEALETKGKERKSCEEMESHRSKFEDQVKSFLNEEQKDLFDKFMESKKQSHSNNSKR